MDWAPTVCFHAIINDESGCIWNTVLCMILALRFYARMDSSSQQEKLQCQREEVNEQKHYTVVIVKRTTGCTENQDSWLWANWQHVYFFSKLHRNIKCTITGARKSRIARLLFLLLYKEEKVVWLCETRSKMLYF